MVLVFLPYLEEEVLVGEPGGVSQADELEDLWEKGQVVDGADDGVDDDERDDGSSSVDEGLRLVLHLVPLLGHRADDLIGVDVGAHHDARRAGTLQPAGGGSFKRSRDRMVSDRSHRERRTTSQRMFREGPRKRGGWGVKRGFPRAASGPSGSRKHASGSRTRRSLARLGTCSLSLCLTLFTLARDGLLLGAAAEAPLLANVGLLAATAAEAVDLLEAI